MTVSLEGFSKIIGSTSSGIISRSPLSSGVTDGSSFPISVDGMPTNTTFCGKTFAATVLRSLAYAKDLIVGM